MPTHRTPHGTSALSAVTQVVSHLDQGGAGQGFRPESLRIRCSVRWFLEEGDVTRTQRWDRWGDRDRLSTPLMPTEDQAVGRRTPCGALSGPSHPQGP